MPPPMSSQSALCFADAPTSRGNQARGTATVRPSDRTTLRSSSVQDTFTASASALSTKVLMPLLQEELLILRDDLADFGQFVAAETAVVRECNRLQPELRITASVSNVDVRWLSSLETVKKESITTNPQKRRYGTSLPLFCATENFPLDYGNLQA